MAKRTGITVLQLAPHLVREISYRCRPSGYDEPREEGIILAYWTGEIDTWGKYTIKDASGGPTPVPVSG